MENMGLDLEFWQGKRVLVTGHTGFKGGWLCLWLKTLGADVIGYSLHSQTGNSFYEIAEVKKDIISLYADITDYQALEEVFHHYQPEIVFHFAAQSIVSESYRDPVTTISSNVLGTTNLLEIIRKLDSKSSLVIATTDKVYQQSEEKVTFSEVDPIGGRDPYAISKVCVEHLVETYEHSFFKEDNNFIATVRAGNVIGGGDYGKDRLIPDTIKSFVNEETAKVRHPSSIRPWQHVLEALYGYLLLAERGYKDPISFRGAWNFGGKIKERHNASWVVDNLASLWGRGVSWEVQQLETPFFEFENLSLNSNKAKENLGWKTHFELEEALCWVVDWYHAHRFNANMRSFSELQIMTYQDRVGKSR